MFKNALISVSDKTGLEDFVRPLAESGMRIVSSGGTADFLKDKGFKVTKVSEQTGFPEVMGGRVKTLHPLIHMPILQRGSVSGDHSVLKEYGIEPFDLLIVNLYPFAQGLRSQKSESEMVELIDIGGPSLLRGAAKNFANITVVCDPSDYSWLKEKKALSLEERKLLATKVFQHTAQYDSMIQNYLSQSLPLAMAPQHHDFLVGDLQQNLRYGENPHQEARWYRTSSQGLHQAKILQGKELSYNNLLDLDAALSCLRQFSEPTAVAVKHNSPCGIGSGESIALAVQRCLAADPVSVFGGIVAINGPLDLEVAQSLNTLFLECVIAPEIHSEAQALLANKKNLRVLIWPEWSQQNSGLQYRSIAGGYLLQTADQVLGLENWKVVSGELSAEDKLGLLFAWRSCASLKSNAIAITSQTQTLGMGMGQVNRVDAVDQALQRVQQFHSQATKRYMASDAFFPFADSIEKAANGGITAIVQPGGSVKDSEVIAEAKKRNIPMVFTGVRHFKH